VELDDLVRFLEAPVKTFLRQRLGLSMFSEDDDPGEAVPIELDALEKYHVGHRLLEHRLAGVPRGQVVRAEWLRGDLPPGPLGETVVTPVADEVDALVAQTEGLRTGDAVVLDAAVTLPDLSRVSGTVPGVYGDRLVRVVYSQLGTKHRLRAWVQLLLVVAAHEGRDWTAATVGRGRTPTLSQLVPPSRADAVARLAELVAVYRAGLESPLPLAPRTSGAYADKRHRGSPVAASTLKAEGEWRRSYQGREIGEFGDAEHLRVWGDRPLGALLAAPVRADLAWSEEGTLFGQLARVVWEPLLSCERIVTA
jgi:exodeoxyribonuclease V gamma subunit